MQQLLFVLLLLFSSLGFGQSLEFRSNSRHVLGTQENKTASISLGDIDQDGDLDMVVANGRHWPQQNQVFYNSGKGKFTVSQPLDIISSGEIK